MTDEIDEFTITSEEDGDQGKKDPQFEFFKELDGLMSSSKKLQRYAARERVMGLTERIFKEDRDAGDLFCDRGRCELHGIKCLHPNCMVCFFCDMQSKAVCAVMDNLDDLHESKKNWRLKNAKKKEGEGESVPEDLLDDTDER